MQQVRAAQIDHGAIGRDTSRRNHSSSSRRRICPTVNPGEDPLRSPRHLRRAVPAGNLVDQTYNDVTWSI